MCSVLLFIHLKAAVLTQCEATGSFCDFVLRCIQMTTVMMMSLVQMLFSYSNIWFCGWEKSKRSHMDFIDTLRYFSSLKPNQTKGKWDKSNNPLTDLDHNDNLKLSVFTVFRECNVLTGTIWLIQAKGCYNNTTAARWKSLQLISASCCILRAMVWKYSVYIYCVNIVRGAGSLLLR